MQKQWQICRGSGGAPPLQKMTLPKPEYYACLIIEMKFVILSGETQNPQLP